MIEGVDFEGKKCKVFVENNVSGESWKPSIVTDSEVLKDWESSNLRSTVEGVDGGVIVKISCSFALGNGEVPKAATQPQTLKVVAGGRGKQSLGTADIK